MMMILISATSTPLPWILIIRAIKKTKKDTVTHSESHANVRSESA